MAFSSKSQVLGSSVHLPEGQRDASSAAHFAAQLVPLPQLAICWVLSLWQQVTLLVWLELVKAKSKNTADREVRFADIDVHEVNSVELLAVVHVAVSIGSPSQREAVGLFMQ